eukprot:3708673-Amphidinium_carterae.1
MRHTKAIGNYFRYNATEALRRTSIHTSDAKDAVYLRPPMFNSAVIPEAAHNEVCTTSLSPKD